MKSLYRFFKAKANLHVNTWTHTLIGLLPVTVFMQCSKFSSGYYYVSLEYLYNSNYLIVNKMVGCAAPNCSENSRIG